MRLRRVIIILLLSIILMPVKAYGRENGAKAYIVVMNKLLIDDIESMENLKNVAKEGAVGLMNTRGVSGYTGPESFITINSSTKASANYNSMDFQSMGSQIINLSIDKLIRLNENNNYFPLIGSLGEGLNEAGYKTGIYGNSDLLDMPIRASALIPMNSKGIIDYGNVEDITLEDPGFPSLIKTDFPKLIEEIKNSPADLIVIDTGDLDRLFRSKGSLTDLEYKKVRDKTLSELDVFINELMKIIVKENSLLIITSPNSGDMNVGDSKLSPIILWGNSIKQGTITSATTHRNMIVTNLDIGPTVMDFFGQPITNVSGSVIKSIEKNIVIEDIIKENQRINIISKVRYNTLYSYGIFSMVCLSIAIILLLGRIKMVGGIKDISNLLFMLVFLIPALFILQSIFRARSLMGFLTSLIILFAISLLVLWRTKTYENQTFYICIISSSIIILDLLLDGFISRYSVLSHDPIIGARYYGIGNEMTGFLLGSITILGIISLENKPRSYISLFLLIPSAILIGYPLFGANLGGGITFFAAIIFFVIEYFEIQINIKKVLYLCVALVGLLLLMGFLDIIFSKNITHLGRTILIIRDSGLIYFVKTIFRKLLMNIKLSSRSFWTNLLLLHMILHGLLFYFDKLKKYTLIGYISGMGGILAGFLLNDSGLILASLSMNLITMKLYLDYT